MTGCEAALALLCQLAARPECLPPQHARHLPAIVSTLRQESRFNPFAVGNDTRRESKQFRSQAEAVAYAVAADRRGETVGLGWGQITHRANWSHHTGTEDWPRAIAILLDPCQNLRATAAHWDMTWRTAAGYNAGPGRINNPPPATAAYATRVAAGALAGAPVAVPAATPQRDRCAGWDAWAAIACRRRAAAPPTARVEEYP